MPFYEVQHTYPLSAEQQAAIAQQITDLHSTTFLVPSLFVNVVFQYLRPTNPATTTYFLAGKPTSHNSAGPNRILGMVRQGPTRTKADFDRLAQRIEDAWYEVVNSPDKAASQSKEDRNAKKLHMVVMYPMIAARENGTTIPGAGEEATWLKDNMPYFKTQAYDHDDDDFRNMLDEVDHREDLKALIK